MFIQSSEDGSIIGCSSEAYELHKDIEDIIVADLVCTAKDGALTIKDTTNGTEYAGTYEVADESKDSVIYNVVIGEDTGTAVSSITKADDGSEAPTLIITVDEYSLTFYE